jgi:hypothetical protein
LKEVSQQLVAAVDGGVLPNGHIPELEDLLVVEVLHPAQMRLQKGTHQLVHDPSRPLPG